MKNIISRFVNLLLILVALAGFTSSCESLNDTYTDFLGEGERVYVGKIDSLKVFSGYERVQVQGLLYYARTAKEIVVEWEGANGLEQVVADLDGYSKWDTIRVNIEPLEEGVTRFFVYTRDEQGSKSVVDEAFVDVYGPLFLLTQSSRGVNSLEVDGNLNTKISWAEPEYYVIDTKLSYFDENGVKQSITVNKNHTETIIPNWQARSVIEAVTRIKPKETDLDTMSLAPVTYNLPVLSGDFSVDGRDFVKCAEDPFNTIENAYGGVTGGLFDGNEATIVHTSDGGSVPHHFSYDMGKLMNLSKSEMVSRSGVVWRVGQFQVWGLPDFDDPITNSNFPAIADNFANRDIWESKAEELGWVILGESSLADPDLTGGSVELNLDKNPKVRYIMFRVLGVYDGSSIRDGDGLYSATRELYLWHYLE